MAMAAIQTEREFGDARPQNLRLDVTSPRFGQHAGNGGEAEIHQ
jgi:hypothetical protein